MGIKKAVNLVSAVCWIITGCLAYALEDIKGLLFIVLFSQGLRLIGLVLESD